MDKKVLFNIGCGMYAAFTNGKKDNACIINTLMQVADNNKVIVSINNNAYTAQEVKKTKVLNVSIIDESAIFDIFNQFGFKTGHKEDKCINLDYVSRSKNNILYLNKYSNSYLSLEVESYNDLGSHTLFICNVIDGEILSEIPTCTYSYYHKNIKQVVKSNSTSGYRCAICGWVYEGDPLPDDIICPICHQGKEAFEKL